MKRRLMALLLAAFLLCPGGALAANGEERSSVDIQMNGFVLDLPHSAWVEEGVTMVPVEDFCRAAFGGARAAMSDSTPIPGTVLCRWAEDGSNVLALTRLGEDGSGGEETLTLELGSDELRTSRDSQSQTQMARPMVWEDGVVYAPLRPLAEELGFKVSWSDGAVSLEREKKSVKVQSLEDFLDAIGDDMEITLAPGTYDFGTLNIDALHNPRVLIDYEVFNTETGSWYGGDRWQAVIREVRDLTIHASGVTFSTPWAYADVLRFQDCRRVCLSGATAVHDVEPGYCTGNCLELVDCDGFRTADCVLDGSGAYGLCAVDSRDVAIQGGEIANCTYGAADLSGCEQVSLSDCRIHDCVNCFSLVGAVTCTDVQVRHCSVERSSAAALAETSGSTGVCFDHCSFQENRFEKRNEYGWQESGGAAFLECDWKNT